MPSTYQELKDQILNFINKPDVEQTIDTFIDLTEAQLNRSVRHWRMERRSTATLDSQYSTLPTDFLEPIRLSLTSGDTYSLNLESQQRLAERRMKIVNTSGRPTSYAITDGTIEVVPTPDGDYTLEMVYYSRVDALSSSNTSNWVLEYYPDAYLYGSLMHTAPFLGDDARMATWTTLFQNAIQGINQDSEKTKYGGSGHRMKIRSY